jgi:hypothetical protein
MKADLNMAQPFRRAERALSYVEIWMTGGEECSPMGALCAQALACRYGRVRNRLFIYETLRRLATAAQKE